MMQDSQGSNPCLPNLKTAPISREGAGEGFEPAMDNFYFRCILLRLCYRFVRLGTFHSVNYFISFVSNHFILFIKSFGYRMVIYHSITGLKPVYCKKIYFL
jgi:hypothetical protein